MMEPKDMENNELRTNSHKLKAKEVAYLLFSKRAWPTCQRDFQIFVNQCLLYALILHLFKHEDLLQLSANCLAMIS